MKCVKIHFPPRRMFLPRIWVVFINARTTSDYSQNGLRQQSFCLSAGLSVWDVERVWVSCGCCNKPPQTRWHQTAEMYPLTVPEARSPKSRCLQRARLHPKPLEKNPSLSIPASGGPRYPCLVAASPQSLPPSSYGWLPSVCVSVQISLVW